MDPSSGCQVRPTCETEPGFHARQVPIVLQEQLARDTYLVRIACGEIARAMRPGQFVMVRLHGALDPLLGRAFALYDATEHELDIVYLVHGKMTRRLAQLPAGAPLDVWGPLGNGFSLAPTHHLVMVAGGIGQTPFLALARAYAGTKRYGGCQVPPAPSQMTLCYGARSADYLAGLDHFAEAQVRTLLATEDGSAGFRGRVTDLLAAELAAGRIDAQSRLCVCGPEPMLAAVSRLMADHPEIPFEVSLETPMACGIGICFSCVARLRQPDGSWDYRRTCLEGPVFSGPDVVWSV